MVFISTGTHETQWAAILFGALQHQASDLLLVHAIRHAGEFADTQAGRHFVEQVVYFTDTDGVKHLTYISFRMGNKRHRFYRILWLNIPGVSPGLV